MADQVKEAVERVGSKIDAELKGGAILHDTFRSDLRLLLAELSRLSRLVEEAGEALDVGVLQTALERAWADCGAMAPHLSAQVINIIGRHMSHHIRDVVRERASLTHKTIKGSGPNEG